MDDQQPGGQDAPDDRAPTDGALVRRVLRGEPEAFGRLFERHADACFRFLLLRTGDAARAEDLVQDAFERALDRLPDLRQPERFRAWLMQIARSLLARDWERRARQAAAEPPVSPDALPTRAADPERLAEPRLRLAALRLHELGEREQRILALRFGAGLSTREAAEQLGCSESAARQLQYRALRRLRALVDETALEADDGEEEEAP